MNFLALIDRFIPEQFLQKNDQNLIKIRVMTSISLLYGASLVGIVLLLGTLSYLELVVVWETVAGSSVAASLYTFQIIYFKRTANWFNAVNIVMLTMFAATTGFIAATGGWTSPVMVVYVCIPMCAFLMEGKKSGVLWSSVIIVAYMVFLALHVKSVQMPQIIDAAFASYLVYFAWVYSWFMTAGGIALYGSVTQRLSESLNQERDKLRVRATYDVLTGAYSRGAFQDFFLESLISSVKDEKPFLYLDVELNDDALSSRREEERILQTTVKIIREAYTERVVIARSAGLSFLVMVDEVDEVVNAEEIALIIHGALLNEFEDLGIVVHVGAVMVPYYSKDAQIIMSGARRAVQDAITDEKSIAVYSTPYRSFHEEDYSNRWIRGTFAEIMARGSQTV